MQNQTHNLPDEVFVAQIVRQVSNESVVSINRFPIGLCHFVYDVVTQTGQCIVARVARPENQELLADAIYWHQLLKPIGVPLPDIIYADTATSASPFPFMILERLPGEDLNNIYQYLSKDEKKKIAGEISHIQQVVGTLPFGKGYGFVGSYNSGFFRNKWIDVLYASLNRSQKRIKEIGAIDSRIVDRVAEKFVKYDNYLSQVKPQCFLDDITTKNVIVHKGKLSGIVDVDFVCFGDNLFTIALTQMSLLKTGFDLDYIDFWCEAAGVTDEQKDVVQLYTALFCVDFMSELGQIFNKKNAQPIKSEDLQRLNHILEALLNQT